jgi:hypothetical protein
MEGMARAAKRESEMALFTAWHTAVFALTGYGGKLKSFTEYLDRPERSTKHAEAIAFFHSLKARGVPVDISRVN